MVGFEQPRRGIAIRVGRSARWGDGGDETLGIISVLDPFASGQNTPKNPACRVVFQPQGAREGIGNGVNSSRRVILQDKLAGLSSVSVSDTA